MQRSPVPGLMIGGGACHAWSDEEQFLSCVQVVWFVGHLALGQELFCPLKLLVAAEKYAILPPAGAAVVECQSLEPVAMRQGSSWNLFPGPSWALHSPLRHSLKFSLAALARIVVCRCIHYDGHRSVGPVRSMTHSSESCVHRPLASPEPGKRHDGKSMWEKDEDKHKIWRWSIVGWDVW